MKLLTSYENGFVYITCVPIPTKVWWASIIYVKPTLNQLSYLDIICKNLSKEVPTSSHFNTQHNAINFQGNLLHCGYFGKLALEVTSQGPHGSPSQNYEIGWLMSNAFEPWIYHGVCTSRNDGHFDVGL